MIARLRGMRKALAPLIIGLAAVPIQWVAAGDFDVLAFRTAAAGLLTALVVYGVKNEAPA